MTIDVNTLKSYVRREPYNEKFLWQTIKEITALVIKRHFSSFGYRDDFFSVATLKALTLLKAPYAVANNNLINFLYTGIRNEIGNNLRGEKNRKAAEEGLAEEQAPNRSFELQGSLAMQDFIKQVNLISCNFRLCGIEIQSEVEDFLLTYDIDEKSPLCITAIKAAVYRVVCG